MRKFISLALLICLLFTGVISYHQVLDIKREREEAKAAEAEASGMQSVEVPQVDKKALYASRDASSPVGTVDGREISWQEYFYFYSGSINEVQNLMSYFGAYGYALSWNDEYEEGITFASVPSENAIRSIRQYAAIEAFAQDQGITLSGEEEDALQAQILSDAERYCGQGAGEKQLEAYLAEVYLPLPVYRQMLHTNAVYQKLLNELYGGESEDGTNEAALSEALMEKLADLTFEPAEGFTIPSLTEYLA